MSDPTVVFVAVKFSDEFQRNRRNTVMNKWGDNPDDYPRWISFGYEHYDSWGKSQNAFYQDDEYLRNNAEKHIEPSFYGYEIAGTWNGIIEFNAEMKKEIKEAKVKLKNLFPQLTPIVVVRGYQV